MEVYSTKECDVSGFDHTEINLLTVLTITKCSEYHFPYVLNTTKKMIVPAGGHVNFPVQSLRLEGCFHIHVLAHRGMLSPFGLNEYVYVKSALRRPLLFLVLFKLRLIDV